MPYVITTQRVDTLDDFDREVFGERAKDVVAHRILSRRAVATLEDPPGSLESGVRGLLNAFVPEETTAHEHDRLYEQIDAISESGGTVGPLPDGTVIEVEAVLQPRMRSDLRIWGSRLDTVRAANDIVATRWVTAYNARASGR